MLLAVMAAGPAFAGEQVHMRVPLPVVDSIPPKPAKPVEKPQDDVKPPDIIKEVPKSRRKLKPIAVPAPLPVKPIKIIRPKVIKRTVGLIG
ncbi:hypothetical protein DLD77_10280 [Chitinophaga alhagiae]|uniref:Uncharacterized protein n=1 Tax=Chitinophaga alhagiae TaxID=2203219 RepID=A0ABM6WDJ5_9BACT|nr:hypothetical protein [Chitinophaga alhagiae]AWO02054.1 hypothetical protein DLD77_10280 [Chitinophaga alhagiae]